MGYRMILAPLLMASVLGTAACSGKVRSEFVAGCTSGGVSKALCKCTFSKLEDRYGSSKLNEMHEYGVLAPDFGDALIQAAARCSPKFSSRGPFAEEALGSLIADRH